MIRAALVAVLLALTGCGIQPLKMDPVESFYYTGAIVNAGQAQRDCANPEKEAGDILAIEYNLAHLQVYVSATGDPSSVTLMNDALSLFKKAKEGPWAIDPAFCRKSAQYMIDGFTRILQTLGKRER